MSARISHSERLANHADELVSKAESAMEALEPKDAEDLLRDAKKVMAEADAQLYPEYEMLAGRLKDDEAKLPQARKARERRDLEVEIAKRREKIDEQVARVKKAGK